MTPENNALRVIRILEGVGAECQQPSHDTGTEAVGLDREKIRRTKNASEPLRKS